MIRRNVILAVGILFGVFGYAQNTVTGMVTDNNQSPLPGVTVIVVGTTVGAQTDFDGKYTISAEQGTQLEFSYLGMSTQTIEVTSNVIDVQLSEDASKLDEVVITALGIKREKKALGYATQTVKGETLNVVKSGNVTNALSGRVSGVTIKRNSNMGGSTNIVIRGSTSLSGNNQALFVIDGVPISNRNTNTRSQEQAGSGYDYGNVASDINPEDIESIEVLKGAAASVLYGSAASNGVIMITTKRGQKGEAGTFKTTISSSTSIGSIIKNTFPAYQKQYGAGYGPYYDGTGSFWHLADIDGDGKKDEYVVTSEDASYGAPFDGHDTYQWNSLYPKLDTYQKKTPWKYADNNDPLTYFKNPMTFSNSVSLEGSGEKSVYRLSYTNYKQDGAEPNATIGKHNISLASTFDFTDKLKSSTYVSYLYQEAMGRNNTGYGGNQMGMFRQWWQTNIDLKKQEDAYNKTGKNISWNPNTAASAKAGSPPIFWDNIYFKRYQSYQSDNRNRVIANTSLDYQFIKEDKQQLSGTARFAIDTYNELQEERLAIGSSTMRFGIGSGIDASLNRSTVGSGYLRRDISSKILNYDFILNYGNKLSEDIGMTALLGGTIRRQYFNRIISSTNGGLNFPGTYSLQNSKSPLTPSHEVQEIIARNSIYTSVSFDYKSMLYLDLSARLDQNSTLPSGNNIYLYPSISTSFLFSELLEKGGVLSFGKLRINYAQVGNATRFNQLRDSYNVISGIGGASTSVSSTKKNNELKPESISSYEAGIDVRFFNNKLGLDLGYYQSNSKDQILPTSTSLATGYDFFVVNAGEIQNRGVELTLSANNIKLGPVNWTATVNWTRNRNKVLSLADGIENYQLGDFQGGVTINAQVGQPYGVIYGADYTYLNGQKVVDGTSGQYIKTSNSSNVIGNQNPDWVAGVSNTFSYKGFDLSFLFDMSIGGDIFSLDQYYGLATGLYKETAFTNDLGNPVRNSLKKGGGFINPGVNPDGSKNTTRIRADRFGAFGYRRGLPDKAFVYDASYVKLRQLSVGYKIPIRKNNWINSAKVSVVGSNLFILYKNLPYADPEANLGSGNLQGYTAGSLPAFRNVAFNFTLTF